MGKDSVSRISYTSQCARALAGIMALGSIALTPAIAATVAYDFVGPVTSLDALLTTSPSLLRATGPLSPMPGSVIVDATLMNNSVSHDGFQINGAPMSGADRPMNALFPHKLLMDLHEPPTVLGNGAWSQLSALPPSISAFTTQSRRLVFDTEPCDCLPPTPPILGKFSALTVAQLPTSVILGGVSLVALIGLGAGALRTARLPQAKKTRELALELSPRAEVDELKNTEVQTVLR